MSTVHPEFLERVSALEERVDELEVRLKALLRMQQAVMRQFEEALETSDG